MPSLPLTAPHKWQYNPPDYGSPMPSLADILREAQDKLEDVTDTPRLDAEILLAHALDIGRAQLLARLQDGYSTDTTFDTMLARRVKAEPIAYILGEWEFFSLPFHVESPVLVPRPETEHLVEVALEHVNERGGEAPRLLEIGTGTGCVAISCLKHLPQATCIATDIRPDNLILTQKNACRHHIENRLHLLVADAFSAISSDVQFDAILSNPPYISLNDKSDLPAVVRDYEDPVALFSGEEGLDMIEILISDSKSHLIPGGLLAFEIGAGQHHNVIIRMEKEGYSDVTWRNDLAGIHRIISGLAPHV